MKKIKIFSAEVFSVLMLMNGCAIAEESVPAEDLYFQDIPVVLTASRLSQPLSEAPSAMTVIDKNMIKASGFRSVPDLMRLVPGMYVSFSDANNPIVSLHGATDEFSRRMQVLLDGRSIYLPPLGSVSWADLPVLIDDIERIEVVRGPSSASYGTNAFYGVINIITKSAAATSGGSVSVSAGAANDASARYGYADEKLEYRVSAGRRTDVGFDNSFYFDRNATNVANLNSAYHWSLSDTLEFQLGASQGIYGAGLAGREDSLFRDTKSESGFQKLSWNHTWTSNHESKLTVSRTTRDYIDPLRCIDTDTCDGKTSGKTKMDGFKANTGYTQRNEVELQNTHQLGNDHRLVWGGGMRTDFTENPLIFKASQQVNTWQAFVHEEWRATDAAIVNIGNMYEDNGMGNRNNSPRASLNYHFNANHSLRFGFSTATRSASLAEAYVNSDNKLFGGTYIQPIQPLVPEKITSREVAYIGDFDRFSLDARAYIDQVTDMIFTDIAPTLVDGTNSVKNLVTADYRGLEATAKFHWDEKKSFLALNYAYQYADAYFSDYPTKFFDPTYGTQIQQAYSNPDKNNFPLAFNQIVPKHSYSILISQNLPQDWQISAGYYYRDQVRALSLASDVPPEYQMRRLDMRVAKTFKLEKNRTLEVAMVLQNVTEQNYNTFDILGWKLNKDNAKRTTLTYPGRGWVTATYNF